MLRSPIHARCWWLVPSGCTPKASQCQIGGKYHIPADGAVVIVIGWLSSSAGGGPVNPGRAPPDHLTRVRKSMFECYAGRGAAAQVHLHGIDYQVNVMVGDRASSLAHRRCAARGTLLEQ